MTRKRAVEQCWRHAVETDGKLFGKAEKPLGGLALHQAHERPSRDRGGIHGGGRGAVVCLDGLGVEAGAGAARPEILHEYLGIAELAAQGLRKAAQTELAGAVNAVARQSDPAEHRTHANHLRARQASQMGEQPLREQHRGEQIGVKHLQHLAGGDVLQSSKARHAGVMHEHVAIPLGSRFAQFGDRAGPGQVGCMPVHAGRRLEALCQRTRLVRKMRR